MILALVVGFAAIASLYAASGWLSRREWNGGICVASGKPWVAFSTDSSGAIGYKDGEGNFLWV